ncbi:MAG: VacJ family lipoprotein [Deltaproteobacteria bacterium]|nr:VacJ family lipoprotein [Deltaproteobacteria bacterium]
MPFGRREGRRRLLLSAALGALTVAVAARSAPANPSLEGTEPAGRVAPALPEGSPAAEEPVEPRPAPPGLPAAEAPAAGAEASPEEAEEPEPPAVPDPLRGWNRLMFTVNDRLYFWVLKPVARGYKAVTPAPLRIGLKNFFHNLATPVRFLNNALQGKVRGAGIELGSFMINSTLGLFGLLDWTGSDPELQVPDEDTGQTLGRWGIGPGLYVVWPLFGPSTLRDTVGMVADWNLDPVVYVEPRAAFGINTGRKVNDLSFRLGDYESLKEAAIDPYEAVRDAYLQYRAGQIEK